MARESIAQAEVLVRAPELNVQIWRNNSGVLLDVNGRPVRFGLGNESKKINDVMKSSDLIGIGPQGRFLAVEMKPTDWTKPRNKREHAQLRFINEVNQRGGIGFFCTSVLEFENMIRKMTP